MSADQIRTDLDHLLVIAKLAEGLLPSWVKGKTDEAINRIQKFVDTPGSIEAVVAAIGG